MPEPSCIDLRTFTAYRVWNELENRPAYARDDAWNLIVRGRNGFVAPFGGDDLIASTDTGRMTPKVLAAAPGSVVTQYGDDGANIRFDARHLAAVAPFLKLYRQRPALSEEHKRKLMAANEAHRFSPGHGTQVAAAERQAPISPVPDTFLTLTA